MNVLFLMISFPDINKDSNLYSDIAEEFRKNGHNVCVAALLEKKHNQNTYLEKVKNLNILRVRAGNLFNTNSVIKKGLTTITIANYFKRAVQKYFNKIKFDLVIYPTPPITFAPVVKYLKQRDKCISYLILRDIFPQYVRDLGLLNNPLLFNYFRLIEKQLYNISDYIGCMSKGIKWIFNEHNVYNRRREFKIFKILDNFTYSRYSKIICVSKQVESALSNWMPSVKGKTKVIPNAVFVTEFLNPNPLKIYDILFVGRLTQAKGVDILLKAVKILKNKYTKNLKIAIVGDGHLKVGLKNLVIELNLNNEVKFLGIRKDVIKLMDSAKIFVLLSRWEGLPMVVLEAMSRGMSIIATNVGGIPEVIENGKEGILISPEDPEILVQIINKLLENEELRKNISQAAYKKVKDKFSIKAYFTHMVDFYSSLVKN